VDISALVNRVSDYFRARVPSLSHRVQIPVHVPGEQVSVQGDPVLLEWALEALVRNAIDALAGREGLVEITAQASPEGGVRIRVSDNGPGVIKEHRSLIFQAGFTTKERGWGVGLALTRRIVEENHRGRLVLVQGEQGATFDILLP
jgi:signal transduction histidine kinase